VQTVNIFGWITLGSRAYRLYNDLNVPIDEKDSDSTFLKNRTHNGIPTDSVQVHYNKE